jgi:hypothetical protein
MVRKVRRQKIAFIPANLIFSAFNCLICSDSAFFYKFNPELQQSALNCRMAARSGIPAPAVVAATPFQTGVFRK